MAYKAEIILDDRFKESWLLNNGYLELERIVRGITQDLNALNVYVEILEPIKIANFENSKSYKSVLHIQLKDKKTAWTQIFKTLGKYTKPFLTQVKNKSNLKELPKPKTKEEIIKAIIFDEINKIKIPTKIKKRVIIEAGLGTLEEIQGYFNSFKEQYPNATNIELENLSEDFTSAEDYAISGTIETEPNKRDCRLLVCKEIAHTIFIGTICSKMKELGYSFKDIGSKTFNKVYSNYSTIFLKTFETNPKELIGFYSSHFIKDIK